MITEQSMTTIQEALESKRKFVLDMLDKYHKTDYDSQELKEWASDLRKELDGIDAALAELAQRAKPDAQGEWQPLNGYIHFSLANGHLVICDARSIDGLPFPDDVAICRKRTAPVEVQPVQAISDDVREALAEYAHEAWSGWMKYMFSKCEPPRMTPEDKGNCLMPAWSVERWTRQMNTPYADLSEEEKDSDRAEADRMLAIVQRPAVEAGA